MKGYSPTALSGSGHYGLDTGKIVVQKISIFEKSSTH